MIGPVKKKTMKRCHIDDGGNTSIYRISQRIDIKSSKIAQQQSHERKKNEL